jgi:hypothetical protein
MANYILKNKSMFVLKKRRKKSFDHDVYSLSANPLAQSWGTNKTGFGQMKIWLSGKYM